MALEAPISTPGIWFTDEDKLLRFTIYVAGTTPDMIEAGTAEVENISGWTMTYMVKRRKTDSDANAKITKTVGGGITLTAPIAGRGEIQIGDGDITVVSGGVLHWHELRRMDSGAETVLFYGPFILNQGVIR